MKRVIICLMLLLIAIGATSCGVENKEVLSVEDYEMCLGANGAYREANVSRNTIWPLDWSETVNAESFYYRYYNPWDPNHLGYLKLTYTDMQEYEEELQRLKNIESTNYIGRYGITGFNKELCAIILDNTDGHGMIYALTDRDKNEIVYVVIDFCNFFSDIKDYKEHIEYDYLPIGLDISESNPTRIAFEKGAE